MAPATLQDITFEPLGRPGIKPAKLTEDPVAAAARRAALLAQIEQENAALAQPAQLNLPAWLLEESEEEEEEMEQGQMDDDAEQQAQQDGGDQQQEELEDGEWVEGPQAAEVHDDGAEHQEEEEVQQLAPAAAAEAEAHQEGS